MITIIVAAHGALAGALAGTAEGILGPQIGLVALGLGEDEAPEMFRRRIEGAMAGRSDGCLVLADLEGGAPAQAALAALASLPPGRGALVSGVSLPMLLEALLSRDGAQSTTDLSVSIADAACEGIRVHPLGGSHG